MKQDVFCRVVEQQNRKNEKMIKENFRQVLEEEFVLGKVFSCYLDFIERNKQFDNNHLDLTELMKKDGPPTKKLRDFDIGKHIPDMKMYLHKHTYIEMDYVYQGSCTYYLETETNPFQLKEKELCIVNQNVVHGIETNRPEDIVIKCMIPFEYIEMERFADFAQTVEILKFLNQATMKNVTKPCYMLFQISNKEYFEQLVYDMLCEYLEKKTGWRQAVKNDLSNLFLYLMRADEKELLYVKENEEEHVNITKILECIRRNYQVVTLRDLAKDFHFHENYLSRMIKQSCQISFQELVCKIRLEESEKLLVQTDLSVAEIALRVGYCKPNYFFKLFKKHYKMTPMEFRSKHVK